MKKIAEKFANSTNNLWLFILLESVLSLGVMVFCFLYPGNLEVFPKVFSHFSTLCMDIAFWADVKTIPWLISWLVIAFSVLIYKFVLVVLAKKKKKFAGIGTLVVYSVDLVAFFYNCITFAIKSDSATHSFLGLLSLYFIFFPLVISFFYIKNYQNIETTKFTYPKKAFLKDIPVLLTLVLILEFLTGVFCAIDVFIKTKVTLSATTQPLACLLVNNSKQTENKVPLILALALLLITLVFIILVIKKVYFAGIALTVIYSFNLIGALYINISYLMNSEWFGMGILKTVLTFIIYGFLIFLCVKRVQQLKTNNKRIADLPKT